MGTIGRGELGLGFGRLRKSASLQLPCFFFKSVLDLQSPDLTSKRLQRDLSFL